MGHGKMKKMKKGMGNVGIDNLDMDSVHIKENQGSQMDDPKVMGKNNVFGKGVKSGFGDQI